jgi:long-chain fatty acid transport protein
MSRRRVNSFLLTCCGAGALLTATLDANAGGFAIREQSAYGQGSSFAGIAAGGALSAMFWNPAIITQFNGKTVEQDVTGILPHSSHSFTFSSLATQPVPGSQGIDALVPSGYASWQLNDRLWLGMSVNAPFGLGVHYPQVSAASTASASSANVQSYNFAPTVAYKINDMVSVALGVQAQYMKASYDAFLSATPLIAALNGAGWSWGWTAGVTLTPLPKTQIGIGYRSAIDQKINGSWDVPAAAAPATQPGSVHLTIPLPDTLTIGLRQGIGDRFTLLAGLEWARWSRIGTVPVLQGNGNPVTLTSVLPGPVVVVSPLAFPFQYKDGWFYSLGGEYVLNPAWTVRAGIAFEKSPVTDGVRTTRIPDNDRMWYSVGASYKPASLRGFTFDAGYSFIDVKNAPVCVGLAAGCASNPWSSVTGAGYNGSVSSYINVVSLAVRYQWDDAAPAPIKQGYFKAK